MSANLDSDGNGKILGIALEIECNLQEMHAARAEATLLRKERSRLRAKARRIDDIKNDIDSALRPLRRYSVELMDKMEEQDYDIDKLSGELAQYFVLRLQYDVIDGLRYYAKEDAYDADERYHTAINRYLGKCARVKYLSHLRQVAIDCKVPKDYHDRMVVRSKDGQAAKTRQYDIYFGGLGQPDGPGHAHYVAIGDLVGGRCENLRLTYRREPGARRGPQNCIDQPS